MLYVVVTDRQSDLSISAGDRLLFVANYWGSVNFKLLSQVHAENIFFSLRLTYMKYGFYKKLAIWRFGASRYSQMCVRLPHIIKLGYLNEKWK